MLFRRLCTSLAGSHLKPSFPRTKSPNLFPKFPPNPQKPTLYTPNRSISSTSKMTDSVRIPSVETADEPSLYRALESSLGTQFTSDPFLPPPNPLILVISGPSGVGKDALINRLRAIRPNLHFVVTATTRAIRPNETHGEDYFFMTKQEFLQMVDHDELLEYALVYGDYKGIPKSQIRDYLGRGCDVVLRVDVQGAATLRRIMGDKAVFVFVAAESERKLVERLIGRRTESKDKLLLRVASAREEIKHVRDFDYVIVNAEGELENSVKLLESIIDAEKAKVVQRKPLI